MDRISKMLLDPHLQDDIFVFLLPTWQLWWRLYGKRCYTIQELLKRLA